MELLNDYYIYIKGLHFLAFVSWMAALFYMPRLFVYHTENKDNADFVRVVKVQERRLYKGIQVPAMLGAVITGGAMLWAHWEVLMVAPSPYVPFFHIKLACTLLLLVYHFSTAHYLKQLRDDKCTKSGVFFRVYNEAPTLLFIGIVCCFVGTTTL